MSKSALRSIISFRTQISQSSLSQSTSISHSDVPSLVSPRLCLLLALVELLDKLLGHSELNTLDMTPGVVTVANDLLENFTAQI